MTKEQEEAIEILNLVINRKKETHVYYFTLKKAIETVLSMLEEKDKVIDKLNKHNNDLLRKLRSRVKEVKKLEKYSLYKKEFSNLNKQLKNKDKIIDLMAEFLNKRSWREHQLKDDTCYCCKIENGADDCKDCIKQYFENKAKELLNK